MVLKLTQKKQEKFYDHAQKAYPEECCGILLGQFEENGEIVIVEVWQTENVWESSSEELFSAVPSSKKQKTASRRDRFTIDPAVLLKAQKYARENNLDIVGIYHSHPDQSAYPSEFDRAIAWDTYSYIIMSVEEGTVVDCRSWRLNDQQQFQEEKIIVTEGCHN